MASDDPTVSNPNHYRILFENEHVRVLEYTDVPGDLTTPHVHPNTVMVALTDFQRRLITPAGDRSVELKANQAVWLPAQRHAGENTGSTPTHNILVELKGAAAGAIDAAALGPEGR